MTKPLRIAVADDEPDMRDYLKTVLERLGHIVLGPVENGAHLVELCVDDLPDLVITDIRMPELDGDQAIKQIHHVHPVPCIVLSAFGNSNDVAFDTSTASWALLTKPFRKHELHDAIAKLMNS